MRQPSVVDCIEPDDDVLQGVFGGRETSLIFLEAVRQFADELFQLSVELVEPRPKPEQNWRLLKQFEPVGDSLSCLPSDVLESSRGFKGCELVRVVGDGAFCSSRPVWELRLKNRL